MSEHEEYIKQLEAVISKFLEPLKGIPYPVAIKALTGCKVLSFDLSIKENQELLELLKTAAHLAGSEAYKKGIFTGRPNEAGNHMEPFVVSALRKLGLRADKPRSRSGKIKVVGYPDIEIIDNRGKIIYLDCKTYNTDTKNQSFRTFYFSPSRDPKITRDAFHLLLSFELTREAREAEMAFVPISWQLYTLENLQVQVKHEFNASNKDLYKEEFLLAKGKLK
ncbi:MAG: hypothetical protein XD63_0672 [Thermoanaerobacterales bacterium 50_218]|nr:MAG: hypothetical protein XD63_0672 [Thermoanaerobacterales bacterium 50_218]